MECSSFTQDSSSGRASLLESLASAENRPSDSERAKDSHSYEETPPFRTKTAMSIHSLLKVERFDADCAATEAPPTPIRPLRPGMPWTVGVANIDMSERIM
jgi:hypothetical protein